MPLSSVDIRFQLQAIALQAIVSSGLIALCWWSYRKYRKPVFAWWTGAAALELARVLAIGAFAATGRSAFMYWHQVATGWTALAVLATALVFSQQLEWRRGYWLVVLFPPAWAYLAIYQVESFPLSAWPFILFLSGATLGTGWMFLRYAHRAKSSGAVVLGVTLLLWGIHYLDYPVLRAYGIVTPWTYYLDILFLLGTGTGILLLVADDLRQGASALATLAAAWEGAASTSQDALIESILTRMAAIPAVRGTALLAHDASGRLAYHRGAGVCANWTGEAVAGKDARVVEQVHRQGESIIVPRWHTPVYTESARRGRFPYAAVLPVPSGEERERTLVIIASDHEPFAALDTIMLAAFGRQVGGALAHASLYEAVAHRTRELERLSTRMVVQHEDERRRLARELHDETAQLLTAIKMELGVLRGSVTPEQAERVDDALALTDAGIRSIRAVIQDLRPSLLDDLGLLPALRSVATAFAERSGIGMVLQLPVPSTFPAIPPNAELALFRAVQEALANVVRHADAHHVWVSLNTTTSHIILTVRDDGQGPTITPASGTGIVGIQERVSQLGGRAELRPWPDGGTCLDIYLPVVMGDAA